MATKILSASASVEETSRDPRRHYGNQNPTDEQGPLDQLKALLVSHLDGDKLGEQLTSDFDLRPAVARLLPLLSEDELLQFSEFSEQTWKREVGSKIFQPLTVGSFFFGYYYPEEQYVTKNRACDAKAFLSIPDYRGKCISCEADVAYYRDEENNAHVIQNRSQSTSGGQVVLLHLDQAGNEKARIPRSAVTEYRKAGYKFIRIYRAPGKQIVNIEMPESDESISVDSTESKDIYTSNESSQSPAKPRAMRSRRSGGRSSSSSASASSSSLESVSSSSSLESVSTASEPKSAPKPSGGRSRRSQAKAAKKPEAEAPTGKETIVFADDHKEAKTVVKEKASSASYGSSKSSACSSSSKSSSASSKSSSASSCSESSKSESSRRDRSRRRNCRGHGSSGISLLSLVVIFLFLLLLGYIISCFW